MKVPNQLIITRFIFFIFYKITGLYWIITGKYCSNEHCNWSAINRGLSCPLLAGDQPASLCSSTTSQSATALESLHHRNAVKHKHNSQDRIGSSVSRDTVLSNQFEGKVNIMIVLSVKAKLNV